MLRSTGRPISLAQLPMEIWEFCKAAIHSFEVRPMLLSTLLLVLPTICIYYGGRIFGKQPLLFTSFFLGSIGALLGVQLWKISRLWHMARRKRWVLRKAWISSATFQASSFEELDNWITSDWPKFLPSEAHVRSLLGWIGNFEISSRAENPLSQATDWAMFRIRLTDRLLTILRTGFDSQTNRP